MTSRAMILASSCSSLDCVFSPLNLFWSLTASPTTFPPASGTISPDLIQLRALQGLLRSEMNDEADLDIARGPVPGAPLHGSNHEKSARRQAKLIQDQRLALPDTLQGNITVIDQEIDGPS